MRGGLTLWSTSLCIAIWLIRGGARRERHDQIDFAIGVRMVRTDDIFNLDQVNGEAMPGLRRFDDASELDSAGLSIAFQSCTNARFARIECSAIDCTRRRQRCIEPLFELRVEDAA